MRSKSGNLSALKGFRFRRESMAITIAAAVILGVGMAPVYAAAADFSNDDPTAAIIAATPETVAAAANVAISDSGTSAIAATIADVSVTVPRDAARGIQLKSGDTSLSISLPAAQKANSSKRRRAGMVSYKNNDGTSTVPIVENDGSVQINTVIVSASAPTSYRYAISIPAGGRLTLNDAGQVSVLDSSNNWIAGVAPAWAKDATGKSVPTHYSIDGDILVQHLDLTSNAIAYPVVADPWFGIDIIDHTTWANTWQYSPTLQITPTWWGRYGAGPEANGAAWSETLSKTSRIGHPNPDTSAMQVQFDCHWQAVRLQAPNKPTWDLDTKLPWTDFANEVRYGCNYPTGNREF